MILLESLKTLGEASAYRNLISTFLTVYVDLSQFYSNFIFNNKKSILGGSNVEFAFAWSAQEQSGGAR